MVERIKKTQQILNAVVLYIILLYLQDYFLLIPIILEQVSCYYKHI